MRTTLGRKLLYLNALLASALLGLGAALAWGITSLRDAVTSAAHEYAELRMVEEALYSVSRAELCLDSEVPDIDAAKKNIRKAMARLNDFYSFQSTETAVEDEHQQLEMRPLKRARQTLEQLELSIGGMLETPAPGDQQLKSTSAQIEQAMLELSRLASQTDTSLLATATAERTVTILMVLGTLGALLICGAILTTIACYWSVLSPLRRLHAGVRRIASGHFSERLKEPNTREFAELATDFNHMAAELDILYQQLERKVQDASRELVRSERLASVGFLAAGVAHEINNPLHIMSGHAELALRQLHSHRTGRESESEGEIIKALEIIRDEAFRCKGITNKLLSLSKVSDGQRSETSLVPLANEVATMLRGMKKYRNRRLTLQFDDSAKAPVRANAEELKQVILNLAVNALEAVEPNQGEVVIEGSRHNRNVELAVRDNGCGMTPEVVERSFEPFFSARANRAARGVGLGLSISHAIVQSHGGRMTAASDGPGKGSVFTIELPVAEAVPNAN